MLGEQDNLIQELGIISFIYTTRRGEREIYRKEARRGSLVFIVGRHATCKQN
jgi:hypothetical protein